MVCHADEWTATTTPSHAQVQFGEDCGSCHDERGWHPAPGFVHAVSFPLTLGHAERACTACHAVGYAPGATPTGCADCHAAQAARVVDPEHAALTQDCFACHRTDTFWPARFVHSWPLRGLHALTSCSSCHGRGTETVYATTSSDCISCHQPDRTRADAKSATHREATDRCDSCHGFETFNDL